jgi:hypothetical protein
MINTSSISTPDPLVRASYGLLFAGLAIGILSAPFSLRTALLPAVAIFGWSQIGGL